MKRTESLREAQDFLAGRHTSVTFGVFDGLHRGHQAMIEEVRILASKHSAISTLLTFRDHPLNLLAPAYASRRLVGRERKADLLEAMGLDLLITVPFDQEFASQTPEEFFQHVLCDALHAKCIVMGFNNRFGKGGEGDTALMQTLGEGAGIEVITLEPELKKGTPVSSTRIRELLEAGKIQAANAMLTRPHRVEGKVITGDARGRTIGFPTANLLLPDHHIVPCAGVYAVRVHGEGVDHGGMMNIGTRPTFGGGETQVEAHLFDFEGDLYGETLEVDLIARLRRERRFDSAEALVEQLNLDRDHALDLLSE